ncbi:MAG: TIGR04282 family arsenosugar biosynthesis glycosyltransferase [Bacteroidetes Order II. Incertae sedis bacterium]|nr:TIGR04282 family arsenosugar biosynthesis glycosyltransferase [Bacteroidetes Order II. bacterium]
MLRAALLVFAKEPIPGAVKTRLTTLLTPDEAASLYAAFLKDAWSQYQKIEADLRLYVPPPMKPGSEWIPKQAPIFTQQGSGLGERMLMAFLETFKAGYERIVIVGTDHPTLPDDFLEMAFEALNERYSMVIGPSEDGGYYLLGMNEWYPEAFELMHYSHPDVFKQTLARIETTEASLSILPKWYDVDTPQDLVRLKADLKNLPENVAQNTRHFVQILTKNYPQVL